jgi:hypothetical protein
LNTSQQIIIRSNTAFIVSKTTRGTEGNNLVNFFSHINIIYSSTDCNILNNEFFYKLDNTNLHLNNIYDDLQNALIIYPHLDKLQIHIAFLYKQDINNIIDANFIQSEFPLKDFLTNLTNIGLLEAVKKSQYDFTVLEKLNISSQIDYNKPQLTTVYEEQQNFSNLAKVITKKKILPKNLMSTPFDNLDKCREIYDSSLNDCANQSHYFISSIPQQSTSHSFITSSFNCVTPYPISTVPPCPISSVPPYPTSSVPPCPTSSVPPCPISSVPSYPTSTVSPCPISSVPLCPTSTVPPCPISTTPPCLTSTAPISQCPTLPQSNEEIEFESAESIYEESPKKSNTDQVRFSFSLKPKRTIK